MNKAERAMVEALQTRLALRWPPEPPRPVTPAEHMENGVFRGWLFNEYTGEVSRGSTDGYRHSRNDPEAFKDDASRRSLSFSQTGGGPWYLTKIDALHALHYAVAKRCAGQLRQVEARIEAELSQ
jgi:hypothetical protein